MRDVTPDELRGIARIAGLPILDEDVEPLTWRYNAVLEAFEGLDESMTEGVDPLPALPHPKALPAGAFDSQGVRGQGARAQAAAANASGAADMHKSTGARTSATGRTGAAGAAGEAQRGTGQGANEESGVPLAYKTITELAGLIRTREVSPVEVTQAYLDRIQEFDGVLRAYITVAADGVLAAAREAEARVMAGDELGPLHGIPLAHKDQLFTKGIRTTGGSRILADFIPDHDATVIGRLREAGALLLGKLNMTEFATPLTLEFAYGQPRNPWDLERDAGASSVGSGIAVAAGLCAGSLGEDTGGSIRRPASHNNCVGLRPSWGRVSVHGLFPGVWYHDTVGPIARSAADCALLLNAIAGHDPLDNNSADLPVPDYRSVLDAVDERGIAGLRVGVIKEFLEAGHLDADVKNATKEAIRQLEQLGAVVEEVSIPLLTVTSVFNGALGPGRSAYQRSHFTQRPHDLDAASRRHGLLPALFPTTLYQRALQWRSLVRRQVLDACERFDVLVSPCQPGPPSLISDTKKPLRSKEQALEETRRYSVGAAATYAGLPAVSVPCGFSRGGSSSDGLPIGLQIMGKRFDEATVLGVAHAYEQATPWHARRPSFA